MRCFSVEDNGVVQGIPIRRTNTKHYVAAIGDHGLIHVSEKLGQLARPGWLIYEGTANRSDNNRVVINSYNDPQSRSKALVLLRITAVPARKRVTYNLPSDQVLIRCPVSRPYGQRTHRWHEVLAWMNPGQNVVVEISSIFPEIEIAPLEIRYDGESLVCLQPSVDEKVNTLERRTDHE